MRARNLKPGFFKNDGLSARDGLDWLVVGAETGPHRRPCKIEWIRSIKDQCQVAGVPLWIKGIEINGKVSHDMAEWPEDLRIRQMPFTGGPK
jgi:protein gp37